MIIFLTHGLGLSQHQQPRHSQGLANGAEVWGQKHLSKTLFSNPGNDRFFESWVSYVRILLSVGQPELLLIFVDI
jgi:hypothetical protein